MILGFLGRFESGTITTNAVSFSIAEGKERTPYTDSRSKSTRLWYRGAVVGNTDSYFTLMGYRSHKKLLLNKNNMVWWLETK